MPKGTKVESLYQKLRGQGKSKASSAKIAQSATGQALKTGKAINFLRSLFGRK